jgi:AcrR family transcriptional regulator
MPKLIENLPERLMSEAKKQIQEFGYAAVTVRSVASVCGVGVGTVYNYFPSKDALIASFMLEDWKTCVEQIAKVSEESDRVDPVLRCMDEQLRRFISVHQAIFRDESAAAGFAGSFSKYHTVLRSQLAQPLRKFCSSDFAAEFAAEAMLTWTSAGKDFQEIYGMMKKIF